MASGKGQFFDVMEVDRIAHRLKGRRRILFWGEMGSGKSTLAVKLAREMNRRVGPCQLLSLDPGTPPFGVPGAICRGWWSGETLRWGNCQALCTLNASRFRLPLILAVRRLLGVAERIKDGPILIDPPGVVRGVGAAELLMALAETLRIDALVALIRRGVPLLPAAELASLSADVLYVEASPEARRPSKLERSEHRTGSWDRFLAGAGETILPLDRVHLLGTPPPRQACEAWAGRQAALLNAEGATVRMGEIIRLADANLTLRMGSGQEITPFAVLVRDAGRNRDGRLVTLTHVDKTSAVPREPAEMTPSTIAPEAGGAPVSSRVGPAWATLVGGVFGDPLLHVRLRNLKRSFLFDLGDPARLTAKVAHQVSAVFLSHAHLDHIGGFPWFLRSRIGPFEPCKIFGPPDTIDRIEHFLGAITWDRIEDNAPIFEVCEIDNTSLKRARLQPGKESVALPELPMEDGIILDERSFTVRAVVCDHHIPSVAYGLVFSREIKVRKERLAARRWPPGPWLGRLKQCIAAEELGAEIAVPDGTLKTAGELAEALTIIGPGKKLVYAADMADSPENREKLIDLARSAHTFFCETAFTRADRERARATQHLTTLAAVEIARQAGVDRLVPFHFSKRYERNPGLIYDEILAAAGPIKVLGHFS